MFSVSTFANDFKCPGAGQRLVPFRLANGTINLCSSGKIQKNLSTVVAPYKETQVFGVTKVAGYHEVRLMGLQDDPEFSFQKKNGSEIVVQELSSIFGKKIPVTETVIKCGSAECLQSSLKCIFRQSVPADKEKDLQNLLQRLSSLTHEQQVSRKDITSLSDFALMGDKKASSYFSGKNILNVDPAGGELWSSTLRLIQNLKRHHCYRLGK